MNNQNKDVMFHWIAGIVFSIVALVHLSRVLFGFPVIVGSWSVPFYVNVLGFIVTGILAWYSFSLTKQK